MFRPSRTKIRKKSLSVPFPENVTVSSGSKFNKQKQSFSYVLNLQLRSDIPLENLLFVDAKTQTKGHLQYEFYGITYSVD